MENNPSFDKQIEIVFKEGFQSKAEMLDIQKALIRQYRKDVKKKIKEKG